MESINFLTHFENLLQYREWVDSTFKNLSSRNSHFQYEYEKNYIDSFAKKYPKWFGSGVTFEELSKGITTYKNPQLIERIFQKVEDKVPSQTKDKIKARKVKYNPFGLGVFVFDRASMGMFRLKELYSEKHQNTVEREEVNYIKDEFRMISDNSIVTERWEQKKDGKPKVRTTSKDVYAYFPPITKDKQAVDIFISAGGHSEVTAEQFLYSGISAIIVAQLLEKAHVKTKISLVIGSSPDNFNDTVVGAIIPIKKYDEPLDINLIALLSSDPRFFRFEGLKGIISLYDHFKERCPSGLGRGMTKTTLESTMNEYIKKHPDSFSENRFYFGWTFNEDSAIDQINTVVNEIAKRI
jgi:hypothetical protein